MENFTDLVTTGALGCGNLATLWASPTLVWQLLNSSHFVASEMMDLDDFSSREAVLLVAKKTLGWHRAPKSIGPVPACP